VLFGIWSEEECGIRSSLKDAVDADYAVGTFHQVLSGIVHHCTRGD
jgi:hypothetical protein